MLAKTNRNLTDRSGINCCVLLLLQAGMLDRGQFGTPDEWESPPLRAATKQRQVKSSVNLEDIVCSIVICEVLRTVKV